MRFSDYKIKTRIYTGFGALVMIAAAVAVFGVFQLGDINRQVTRFVGIAGNSGRNLNVQHIAERMRRDALKFQTNQDEAVIAEFDADQAKAIELLAEATKMTVSDERRRIYGEASATIAATKQNFDKLTGLGKKYAAARTKLFSGGDELTAATGKLVEAARAQSELSLKVQVTDVETSVLLVRIANWRFLATHDPKGPATFKMNADKTSAAIALLEKNAAVASLQEVIAAVKASLAAYATNFGDASDAILQANELYEKTMAPQFQQIEVASATAQKTLDSDFAGTQRDTTQTVSSTITLQGGLAVVAVLLGGALAYLIGRSIANPVTSMTAAMQKLAAGDKSAAIPAQDNRDEIGGMAKAVSVFKENMVEGRRAGRRAARRAGA